QLVGTSGRIPGQMVLRERLRQALCWSWVLLAGLLALIAAIDLVSSIANAHYDPHENRSPVGLIVIAAIGAAAATGALSSALGTARGRLTRIGVRAGLVLTSATVALILLYTVAAIASGPL